MRRTSDTTLAMKRLAEALGWTVESTGQSWHITSPETFDGLTYSNLEALCVMVRVAMSSKAIGGWAWTPADIRDRIRFEAPHIFNHKKERYFLWLPHKCPATEEATMYQTFYLEDGGQA
jgi:hypothetical protein